MLVIDKLSRVPIYEQIVSQIETHIRLGEFTPEEPLPSVRALSVALGINPNTLQKAYQELERREICMSVPGSGRYVRADAKEKLLGFSRERLGELSTLARRLHAEGIPKKELVQTVEQAIDEPAEEERDNL